MADIKLNDPSLTTITALVDTDLLNPVFPGTGEIQKITVANAKASITGFTKLYVSLLSQSGTAAPSDDLIVNTLGATITYSRNGIGDYNVTASASVFTNDKTMIFALNGDTPISICAVRMSATVINLKVVADSTISFASFKIEIYP